MENALPPAPLPGGPHRSLGVTPKLTMPDASPRNDDAVLAVLRCDLGEAVFRDVLAGLGEELMRRLRSVQAEPWDWHGIREDAQAVLSLAVGFGFETLAARSRSVLSVCACPAHRSSDALQLYAAEVERRLSATTAMSRASDSVGRAP